MLQVSQDKYHSGFKLTFENGNTISVQFGYMNYCGNRNILNIDSCIDAEIAIWDKDNNWYKFENDTVKGWCNADEVANWIDFAKKTKLISIERDADNLINVVLPMLAVPNVDKAKEVIATVFEYNDTEDLQDLDFFKECASLIISEKQL